MDTGYEFIGWDQLLYVWGPRVLGAAVILIAAYFIGKGLKWALARGVDKLPGAHHTNAEGDPKKSVGARLGEVVYWLVLLVGVVAALTVLQLGAVATPLNTLLSNVFSYVPNIVGAALIFFVGFVLATIAKRLVEAALQAVNLDAGLAKLGLGRATGATNIAGLLGTLAFVLIIIPVTIAALEQLGIEAISGPAIAVLSTVFDAVPRVLAALIVLALGWVIGRWVGTLVERVVASLGFDRSVRQLGDLSSFTPSTGGATPTTLPPGYGAAARDAPLGGSAVTTGAPAPTPSKIVGALVTFAIVAFSAIEATRLLNFAVAAGLIEDVLSLAVRVLVGGAIITAGVIIGDLLSNAINRSTSGADRFASVIVRWATIALATAMGLSFMGIADEIVILAFGLILGSAAVAAALAFGLGGRQAAAKLLDRLAERRPAPQPARAAPVEPEPRPFTEGPDERFQ